MQCGLSAAKEEYHPLREMEYNDKTIFEKTVEKSCGVIKDDLFC
jgi:hypothetical protein